MLCVDTCMLFLLRDAYQKHVRRWYAVPTYVTVCLVSLSVCVSLCLSVTSWCSVEWLNASSCDQHHLVVWGLLYSDAKHLDKNPMGSPPTDQQDTCLMGRICEF